MCIIGRCVQTGFSLASTEWSEARGLPCLPKRQCLTWWQNMLVCFPRAALKAKPWPYQDTKYSTLLLSWVAKFTQTPRGSSLFLNNDRSPAHWLSTNPCGDEEPPRAYGRTSLPQALSSSAQSPPQLPVAAASELGGLPRLWTEPDTWAHSMFVSRGEHVLLLSPSYSLSSRSESECLTCWWSLSQYSSAAVWEAEEINVCA